MRRMLTAGFVVAALTAAGDVAAQSVSLACVPQRPRESLANRRSTYDSVAINVAGKRALLCYGRPRANGREIFGGLVKYGQLWRTGADEPTTLHIAFPATIAGVRVGPGSYSIYTVPGETEWEVVVNKSTSHWGHESSYAGVKDQEVGRGKVKSETLSDAVDQFTIRATPAGASTNLVLEWEKTRVRIPIVPVS